MKNSHWDAGHGGDGRAMEANSRGKKKNSACENCVSPAVGADCMIRNCILRGITSFKMITAANQVTDRKESKQLIFFSFACRRQSNQMNLKGAMMWFEAKRGEK